MMPPNLLGLYRQEEELRVKAVELVAADARYALHLCVIEEAMDLGDMLRQFETVDEDLKLVQVLGMRLFNAFGACLKLTLSGYSQNAALIMRDILETVFLLDYFQGDRSLITQWRIADKRQRLEQFRPVKVRTALDERDGFTLKRRFVAYDLLSGLAGHPTMQSVHMMRPEIDGDAVVGPFMEPGILMAAVSELGRLALQAGEQLNLFFPENWLLGFESRLGFAKGKGLAG